MLPPKSAMLTNIKNRNKRKKNEYLLYEYLLFDFEQLSLINYHNPTLYSYPTDNNILYFTLSGSIENVGYPNGLPN